MLITLLIVLSLITAWLYSWTFTKHGRIEFLPALICRAATLASRFGDPITYSDSDRANANASTTKLLQLPPTPAVQVDEDTLGLPGRTLKLRWYQHADKVDCPLVLNIHGGAWWMGNDFIDDAVMRLLLWLRPRLGGDIPSDASTTLMLSEGLRSRVPPGLRSLDS